MSTYRLPEDVAARLTALVDEDAAVAVLYHYDTVVDLPEPGSFVKALIAVLAQADQVNRERFSYGFPTYTAAVQLVEGHPEGLARLRAIAGVQVPDDDVARAAADAYARRMGHDRPIEERRDAIRQLGGTP